MKTSRVTLIGSVLVLGLAFVSCKKEGCTDPLAINYSSSANHDNGTCVYDGTGGGSGGNGSTSTVTTDITTPTTLSGVVSICGDIDVNAALTIQAGTVINMCAGASIEITSTGSLSSQGTISSPVVIKGELQSAAYWDGIFFTSNNPNNLLQYTLISDAGGSWQFQDAGIFVGDQALLNMSNSTVSNCSASGLYTQESATLNNFSANTFANNGSFGVNITARQIGSLDVATNYNLSNATDFINVRSALVNTTQTWLKLNTAYLFNEVTQVSTALVIEEGAVFKFESGAGIDVTSSGSLSAIGTATNPITFEGRFATPGYWRSLRFESNNPNNRLAYAIITDGGNYWGDAFSSILIQPSSRLEMDNCSISNSNSWGMYVNSSTTVVSNGVTVTDAAGLLVNNTMNGNGVGPDANCSGGGCTVYFD